jgi:hypothetical protein
MALVQRAGTAVVAHVALRDVNRVIDERILLKAFLSLHRGDRVYADLVLLRQR